MKQLFLFLFTAALLVSSCKPKPEETSSSVPQTVNPSRNGLALRLFPKMGERVQLEAAMKLFSQKHFKDDNKWRIYRVYGGDYDGTYLMFSATMRSWSYYDSTHPAVDAMWAEFETTITPYLTNAVLENLQFLPALSSVPQQNYSTKSTVTERRVKAGRAQEFEALIKKVLPVWQKKNLGLVYYLSTLGHPNRYYSVRRHVNGWSEKDPGFFDVKTEYIAEYGAPAWDDFQKKFNDLVEYTNVQLQVYLPELSNDTP